MADFGTVPTSSTQIGGVNVPVSNAFVPGTAGGTMTAPEGIAINTDANGYKSTALRVGAKDGDIVTLGISTDANTTNTVMGRLTKLRDILLGLIGQQVRSASLSVTVASDQTAIPVSGTFYQATQPVSGTVTANPQASGTGTPTAASANTTAASLLASNASRKAAYIYNESTAVLYLGLFAHATLTTSLYTTQVPPNTLYELPTTPVYTGEISGLWASATGAARITEMS